MQQRKSGMRSVQHVTNHTQCEQHRTRMPHYQLDISNYETIHALRFSELFAEHSFRQMNIFTSNNLVY